VGILVVTATTEQLTIAGIIQGLPYVVLFLFLFFVFALFKGCRTAAVRCLFAMCQHPLVLAGRIKSMCA
jgi:hypothetical protein